MSLLSNEIRIFKIIQSLEFDKSVHNMTPIARRKYFMAISENLIPFIFTFAFTY